MLEASISTSQEFCFLGFDAGLESPELTAPYIRDNALVRGLENEVLASS